MKKKPYSHKAFTAALLDQIDTAIRQRNGDHAFVIPMNGNVVEITHGGFKATIANELHALHAMRAKITRFQPPSEGKLTKCGSHIHTHCRIEINREDPEKPIMATAPKVAYHTVNDAVYVNAKGETYVGTKKREGYQRLPQMLGIVWSDDQPNNRQIVFKRLHLDADYTFSPVCDPTLLEQYMGQIVDHLFN